MYAYTTCSSLGGGPKMKRLSLTLLLVLVVVTLASASSKHTISNQIHLLRPKSGSAGHNHISNLSCDSWRLAVETDNIINWDVVPRQCESYVGHYMLGGQYRTDSKAVCDIAAKYAKGLNLTGDGKDIWVFDIDETSLSNLPYYAQNGFGADEYNSTSFDEWEAIGKAPALPETLEFYNKLLTLGIKPVFITGKDAQFENVTITNLHNVGYKNWAKLILKPASQTGTSLVYKSAERKKLEKQGYRIVGNMGDQWSDITGTNVGKRTFKLPDPMYYIA